MITRRTERRIITTYALVIDDKVINYLFNRIKKAEEDLKKRTYSDCKYVLKTGHNRYQDISKHALTAYLENHGMGDRDFRIISENSEYNLEEHGTIFNVKSASPWDHRYLGDYDEDAYLDVSEDDYRLEDIQEPGEYTSDYFGEHADEFNWKEIKIVEE